MKAILAAAVAGLVVAAVGFAEPAVAQKKESYAACKTRMSKEPPCSARWTKACAAQCGSKYF